MTDDNENLGIKNKFQLQDFECIKFLHRFLHNLQKTFI